MVMVNAPYLTHDTLASPSVDSGPMSSVGCPRVATLNPTPRLKVRYSPANLSINQGVMATLQECRLGYHSRAARAGLEPGTSRFSGIPQPIYQSTIDGLPRPNCHGHLFSTYTSVRSRRSRLPERCLGSPPLLRVLPDSLAMSVRRYGNLLH
jgi:hypothetical protein